MRPACESCVGVSAGSVGDLLMGFGDWWINDGGRGEEGKENKGRL